MSIFSCINKKKQKQKQTHACRRGIIEMKKEKQTANDRSTDWTKWNKSENTANAGFSATKLISPSHIPLPQLPLSLKYKCVRAQALTSNNGKSHSHTCRYVHAPQRIKKMLNRIAYKPKKTTIALSRRTQKITELLTYPNTK